MYNVLLGVNPVRGFVVCFMGVSFLFSISVIFKDFAVISSIWIDVADARVLDVSPPRDLGQEDDSLASFVKHKKRLHSSGIEHDDNKLLNGLLSSQFYEDSCLSRQQIASYRKVLPYKPSPYLISKLRRYEALHKRCGPYTESYNRTVAKLRSGRGTKLTKESSDCKYLVLVSFSGLGNRIMSLVSAFMYALLTDRVLLVDRGVDLDDLFCEPFPESSWFLPLDFPIFNQIRKLNQQSPECFGNFLKMSNKSSTSLYVYLYLTHSYNDHDKLFFCDQEQSLLQNISWVIMKSNQYFVPAFFLMPSFEQELHSLFPDKETVFHFLGTYLLFPTNPVWGLITRYYNSYLAQVDKRIGIQVRVLHNWNGYFQYVLDLVLTCSLNNNLLPKINLNDSFITSPGIQKSKAVLLTSLSSGYFVKIRDMYLEHSTLSGEVIKVFQPSHEEQQQTGNKIHDRKAWAEMYLLSLSDKLITSSGSTFGYVAQSIGGLNPWILYKPKKGKLRNPACTRAMSNEPCFHYPPYFDCKKRIWTDTGAVVPHVRHCEDRSHGLKLVNPNVKP